MLGLQVLRVDIEVGTGAPLEEAAAGRRLHLRADAGGRAGRGVHIVEDLMPVVELAVEFGLEADAVFGGFEVVAGDFLDESAAVVERRGNLGIGFGELGDSLVLSN